MKPLLFCVELSNIVLDDVYPEMADTTEWYEPYCYSDKTANLTLEQFKAKCIQDFEDRFCLNEGAVKSCDCAVYLDYSTDWTDVIENDTETIITKKVF